LNSLAGRHLETLSTTPGKLPADQLALLASPIRRRVVRSWVREITGRSMTLSQTEMVDALVVAWKGQGSVDVPGAKLSRQEGFLLIEPIIPP